MELTLGTLDSVTGAFIVDMEVPGAAEIETDLSSVLGASTAMGCALPTEKFMPDQWYADMEGYATIRIAGMWHNSLVEGPGRRSVVQFQGCPIRCKGCWVPETWDSDNGAVRTEDVIATNLLDPSFDRDGVTIIGGEPFAQVWGLAALVGTLRARQPDVHITIYSGFTLQKLIARNDEHINYVLSQVDVLIDGPYVKALADSAGPWTGSGNQRVHFLR